MQVFNRYTRTFQVPISPATLNAIPYVEIIKGAYCLLRNVYYYFLLYSWQRISGVQFHFSMPVTDSDQQQKATGIRTGNDLFHYDVVISNMDIYTSYQKLMPTVKDRGGY